MKAEGLKPNKVQVWKLINALGDQGIEAEDDL
jgi:biotin operon repressor